MHLLECVFSLEHCISTKVESSPLRVIPLLSISSPCRGILFYKYRERARRRLVLETKFRRKPECDFDGFTCIRILVF